MKNLRTMPMEMQKTSQQLTKQSQEITWWNSPDKFLAATQPKRAIDILNSPNKSLINMMLIRNKEGEVIANKEIEVKALLTILIAQTLDFFSIGKTMSDTQVAMTIEMIIEDYAAYKPDYFILCFKRARKGCYGTTFDRVDGQIIFEWLSKFDTEYAEEIQHERINEKKRIEQDVSLNLTPEQIQSMPDDIRPVPMPDYIKMDYVKAILKPVLIETKPAVTKEQQFLNSIKTDFEMICEQNGQKGEAFIFFHGTTGKRRASFLQKKILTLSTNSTQTL